MYLNKFLRNIQSKMIIKYLYFRYIELIQILNKNY